MKEINEKLDNLISLLDNDPRMIKLIDKKKKLLNNKELLTKIAKLNELDNYSDEYKSLKKEIFENEDFVSYKEIENEIDYLILEINNKLRTLTSERRCNHANN